MDLDLAGLGVEELHELVAELRTERDQLSEALESRIAIEQAKGVLAERFALTVDEAFLLLRLSARSARTKIHELARTVVESRQTPPAIVRVMARSSGLREDGSGNGSLPARSASHRSHRGHEDRAGGAALAPPRDRAAGDDRAAAGGRAHGERVAREM